MRRLMGIREFWIASLRLPGDTLARAENSEHVAKLADSIAKNGVTPLPLVWVLGPKRKILLTGRDIVAALVRLRQAKLPAVAIECTGEEAYQICLADNLLRKQLTREQAEAIAAPLRSHQPYRVPPTEVPEELKPTAAKVMNEVKQASVPEPELHLLDLGMELTPEFRDSVGKTNVELARAAYYLACASACMQRITSRKLPLHPVAAAAASERIAAAAANIKATMPHALCPWCAGVDQIQCSRCANVRWVPESAFLAAPPRLRDCGEDKVVVVDGRAVMLKDILES